MDAIVSPILLYLCLAIAGIGSVLALPRQKISPQLIGGAIAVLGFGLALVLIGLRSVPETLSDGAANPFAGDRPNPFFYVFALIAIGSALRVISHPRPVYSALYFILTILSSASMYLLVGAEFLAFALIIIYAGAILITYLFVIMLATQAPSEDEIGELSEYDASAREPLVAVLAGFLLLAVIAGQFSIGVTQVYRRELGRADASLIAEIPAKVDRAFERRGVYAGLGRMELGELADGLRVNPDRVSLVVSNEAAFAQSLTDERVSELMPAAVIDAVPRGGIVAGSIVSVQVPNDARADNLDGVGWWLIARHPMALEIAGVVLLMAMLGAVVLARRQVDLGEEEKIRALRTLADEVERSS
ncbi:MAG: NADH-quinone oxidoreductase subunit J [Planctomycetota bacterium]